MALKVIPSFGGIFGSSNKSICPVDAVNIEPFAAEGESFKPTVYMQRTEGIKLFSSIVDLVASEDRPGRGLFANANGDAYTVVGDALCLVDADGVPTKVMDITDSTSPVSICELAGNLFVCDGTTIWGYNYSTGIKRAASLPFIKPVKIATFGKRVIAINADTTIDPNVENRAKLYWSDASDGYTWDALSWAEVEGRDDYCVGLEIVAGGILLQGQNSIETWVISSDPYRPFVRSSVVPYGGIYSWINSTTTATGTAYWVSTGNSINNVIVSSAGGSFKVISGKLLSDELSSYPSTKDARVWSYIRGGQTYVVFTFISANKTIVYNETQGRWHRRASRNPLTNTQDYYTPLYSCQAYGKILVALATGAYLMELDEDTYSEWDYRFSVTEDNTKPILIKYVLPDLWRERRLMFYQALELDISLGNVPLGIDPKIMLRYSNVGGNGSWSKLRTKKVGKTGQYGIRCRFELLGSGVDRVFEITFADRSPLTLMNVLVDATPGRP